jgi:hypothetical protein
MGAVLTISDTHFWSNLFSGSATDVRLTHLFCQNISHHCNIFFELQFTIGLPSSSFRLEISSFGAKKINIGLMENAAGCIFLGGGLPINRRLPVLIWQP